jgi:hypothetical protein
MHEEVCAADYANGPTGGVDDGSGAEALVGQEGDRFLSRPQASVSQRRQDVRAGHDTDGLALLVHHDDAMDMGVESSGPVSRRRYGAERLSAPRCGG